MRHTAALLAAAWLLCGPGCSKEEDETSGDEAKTGAAGIAPASLSGKGAEEGKGKDAEKEAGGAGAAPTDPAALAKKIGVQPGPVEYDPDEGAAAVVASAQGKVEVRRVGNENWEETKAEAQLHEGDQIRAADGGLVTLTLVDETSVEVAEESAVAIGSRKATQDPASSAALLYGVARFSVADRAPGEGPFLVFTPGGVVAAKGSAAPASASAPSAGPIFTAGVVASGQSRVGVESGEVEVAGSAKLDAPVSISAGHVVVIQPAGEVGPIEATATADWGAWRDRAEADLDIKAAAQFHAQRAEALEAELEATYAQLEVQAGAAAQAEARVEAAETANDPAAYRAAAPEVGGAVDASFAMSLRLHYLTSAILSDAYVADALYVRHPDVVAVIEPARPRLAGAVLWHKKYHAVADLHVEPLRAAYYVHHPVGRAHAALVAYPIPPFYARVQLDYPVPIVTSRVHVAVYRPPLVRPGLRVKRKVYIWAPRIGWYAGVRARVRPASARVRWYVRPAAPRARVVVGAPPSASVKLGAFFGVAPARPRAHAAVRFGAGLRVRDRRRREVHEPHGRAAIGGAAGFAAGVGIGLPEPPRVRAGVRVKAGGGGSAASVRGRGRADARVGAGARVKVKAPKVKVKAPSVRGSVKVKGGLKIGD